MDLTGTGGNSSLAKQGYYQKDFASRRPRRRVGKAEEKVEKLDNADVFRPAVMLSFALAHVPLAIAMYKVGILSTLHGVISIFACTYIAMKARRPEKVVMALAYLVGSEILWRSTNARVPYETGKYFIVIITLITLARERRMRIPWPPFAYFLLMLPSVLLTLTEPLKYDDNKSTFSMVAFNLSGPTALMCSVILCSRLRLSAANFLNLSTFMAAPSVGAAVLTIYAIRSSDKVTFGRTSVSVIREEFGPNQLSAAMGLGALFLVMMLIVDNRATPIRRLIIGAGTLLLLSAVGLSFSRGGFYNFGGALIMGMFVLMRDAQSRLRLMLAIAAAIIVSTFVLVPALDSFTQGGLMRRFRSTNLTGRDKIAWDDLLIWQHNPVYGVGPGRATSYRTDLGQKNQAHTEFTRMLAEHGVLGFAALLLLFYMAARTVTIQPNPRSRAIAVSLIFWSFLYMTNAAMRLSAPSFMFGLACAVFNFQNEPSMLALQPKVRKRRALLSQQAISRA